MGEEEMDRSSDLSFLKCGKVFNPELPLQLDRSEQPILLGEVRVNTQPFKRPCVLIKFSEFINFSLLGLNPKITIFYRLVRESGRKKTAQILEEWEFAFESLEALEVANLDTNQPTVLNFCDCSVHPINGNVTYKLEIIQIETNNVENYGITNKSITAVILNEAPDHVRNSL
jgi:hypothetical protein